MDRRIIYTKKVIKETFINLLSKKDISKITVTEICNISDINRATFYRYYIDIYDLLDKIKIDFINELKDISNTNKDDSIYSFAFDLLNAFYNNKVLVKTLFDCQNNTFFWEDILEFAYTKLHDRYERENPDFTSEDLEYVSIFVFNGALGILNYWVKNDFDKSIDELSYKIEHLCYFERRK